MHSKRQMVLGLDIRASQFNAFWRLAETELATLYDFETYRRLAQVAEERAFHFLFDADSLALGATKTAVPRIFEPTGYFAALAASTSRIGLLPTYSTTFNEPYNLARKIASLDHLSKGRAGWNLVTSAIEAAARNFGMDTLPNHDERYERATEVVTVMRALWDGWSDDALVMDKTAGRFVDENKVRPANYRGQHVSVAGPLSTFRPPQGWPVLAQAGESPAGRAVGSQFADLIYTRQNTKEAAIAYRKDMRERAAANGRDPDSIKIVQAVFGAVADTQAEAEDYANMINGLSPDGKAIRQVEIWTGMKFTDLSESDPLPPIPPVASSNAYQTHIIRLHQMVEAQGIKTVGELLTAVRAQDTSDYIIGSVTGVADWLQDWFESGAVDGFILGHGDQTKYGVWGVFDKLVPELQRRGLHRTEYQGRTFRENLGLATVPSVFG